METLIRQRPGRCLYTVERVVELANFPGRELLRLFGLCVLKLRQRRDARVAQLLHRVSQAVEDVGLAGLIVLWCLTEEIGPAWLCRCEVTFWKRLRLTAY